MKMEFQNIPVSEKLDQVVENSLEQVYTQSRRSRAKSWVIKGGAIAAAFVIGAFVCISNPSIAAELPFIGHIFDRMQDSFGYPGDYSEVGTPLEEEKVGAELDSVESVEKMDEVSKYTQTVDGMTVTLSEVYCNAEALYITVQLKSDEPLPEINDYYCSTLEKYSFTSSEHQGHVEIQGDKIDESTYAGLMRFSLNERAIDSSALWEVIENDKEFVTDAETIEKYVKEVDIPESFTLQLSIRDIIGSLVNQELIDWGKTEEELKEMSEDEWHEYMTQYTAEHPGLFDAQSVAYKGVWNFDLDITMDTSMTQIVELNDYNELGIGFEKVVKDHFEITMYDTYKDASKRIDYFPVMLDADGRLMDYGGNSGSVNTVAIDDRDVSRVDIFLVDYIAWMDELKGDKWREPGALTEDGRTYRELLLERCAYHKEVVFD